MTRIQELETNHHDRITVVDHNLTAKRMLTASADHRVKVYERATVDGEPVLKDTWTAHNADIRDAKWFHPTLGTHIATISNDLTLKIWEHDASQAPNSGRTFRCITKISSQSGVPFVSLSIKHIAPASTYLAVIDRAGNLIIYTPASPETFSDWAEFTKFNVVDTGPPSRTTETSFTVTFDQNITPTPYILNLPSSTQSILSLAVSSLDLLKIYRSSTINTNAFYEAARSPAHPALIRSIAWSNGNIRGHDILASACADGSIRIFDLHTSASAVLPSASTQSQASQPSFTTTSKPAPQSSLTTAIAGRPSASTPNTNPPTTRQPLGSYTHTLTLSALLESYHRDCLAVRFDHTGQLLASMDADGQTVYWRRSVGIVVDEIEGPKSEWIVFAIENEDESEEDVGGGAGEDQGVDVIGE